MIEEIIRLVATREQARLQKDWALADTIRVQLTTMGVTLFDKSSSWKTSDGQTGRIPTFSELDGLGGNIESIIQQQALEMQSAQVLATAMMGGEVECQIKELVKQREQARSNKDFTRSDEIREELKQMGVEVYDKEKMWRAKSGASGVIIGWHSKTGPTDLEITTLVVQREKARQSSDWATSDMIRNELRAVGVEIYDKEKLWKVQDGRQGPVPSWQECQAREGMVMVTPQINPNIIAAMGMQGMSMAMGGAVSLQTQVMQAAMAAAKDPASAAQTLQLLQQQVSGATAMGGQTMMGGGSMAGGGVARGAVAGGAVGGGALGGGAMAGGATAGGAVGARATNMGGAGTQSPEYQKAIEILNDIATSGRMATDPEIEYLVGVREKFRQAKDFQIADEFRNMLRSTIRIELFEKEKRWQTSDGRQGAIPLWTDIMS